MWAYWKDRYGNKVNYWPGGEVNGYGCACGVDKSCAGDYSEYTRVRVPVGMHVFPLVVLPL